MNSAPQEFGPIMLEMAVRAGDRLDIVLPGRPERARLDLVLVRRPQRLSQAHRAPGIYDLSVTVMEPRNVSELAEEPSTPDEHSYIRF
jgi:hypothetical protein